MKLDKKEVVLRRIELMEFALLDTDDLGLGLTRWGLLVDLAGCCARSHELALFFAVGSGHDDLRV